MFFFFFNYILRKKLTISEQIRLIYILSNKLFLNFFFFSSVGRVAFGLKGSETP